MEFHAYWKDTNRKIRLPLNLKLYWCSKIQWQAENKRNFHEVKQSFEIQYSGRIVHILQSDCGMLFHEMKHQESVYQIED
jgi:hypothetical protein